MSTPEFIVFMLTIYLCKVRLIKILQFHQFDLSRLPKEQVQLYVVLSNPLLNSLIAKWNQVHCESQEAFQLEQEIMTLLVSLWKN